METGRKFWIAVGLEAAGLLMAMVMMVKVGSYEHMKEIFTIWGTFAVSALGVFGVTNVAEHFANKPPSR